MLLMIVQVVDQLSHLLQREPLRVKREDMPGVHVVDIRPHCLEWDSGYTVIVDDFRNLEPVLHAVTALMETKPPIWHHGRLADHLRILHSHILGRWSGHEV